MNAKATGFILATTLLLGGSSCNDTGFSTSPVAASFPQSDPLPPPNSDLCVTNPQAEACQRDPVVSTPGVVTILFTLSQVPEGAASLIIANAIKYASPEKNPRILFLKDSATYGEDEGDVDYIKNELLAGYLVDYAVIPTGGLLPAAVGDHDLVIVSNPGHPLADAKTLSTLKAFTGGVILIGDDLSMGNGFSMTSLTGATNTSNGASVTCGGKTYKYDNLQGYFYQVTMNETFLPGIPEADQYYQYGNDIDWVTVGPNVEVLATSAAAPGTCPVSGLPTVFRRPK